MGKVVTLGDIADSIFELDTTQTIYAAEPWERQSKAMVAREQESGKLPSEVAMASLQYCLEIGIAQELIQGWLASVNSPPSSSAICQRLIDCVINDC